MWDFCYCRQTQPIMTNARTIRFFLSLSEVLFASPLTLLIAIANFKSMLYVTHCLAWAFLLSLPSLTITIILITMPILAYGNSWVFSRHISHPLILNLTNKKPASSIFLCRETGTNCPGASCKLSLKNCQNVPQ